MAAPTFEKTWQFNVNQHFLSGTLTLGRELALGIKNSLTGFTSSPWIVESSCDGKGVGNYGNNDQVDRWLTAGDLNWGSPGPVNHSWIVLKQPGIYSNTSICMDLKTEAIGSNVYWYGNVFFSPSAGFGSINGGTNGDDLNPPTASDQIILHPPTGAALTRWLDYDYAADSRYLHVMQSTDGECTRVVLCRANLVFFYFSCEMPKNPHPSWATPVVATWQSGRSTGLTMTYQYFNDASPWQTRINGTEALCRMTSEMIGASMIGQVQNQPNINGEWPLMEAGLRSTTTGVRGFVGELYDMRWASESRNNGDTYPDAVDPGMPEHSWVQFQNIALPWNTDPFVGIT